MQVSGFLDVFQRLATNYFLNQLKDTTTILNAYLDLDTGNKGHINDNSYEYYFRILKIRYLCSKFAFWLILLWRERLFRLTSIVDYTMLL